MSAPISSTILRRIAALKLEPDAMAEVLAIVADIQSAEEDRAAKRREQDRARKQRNRSRGSHAEIRVTPCGSHADTSAAAEHLVAAPPPEAQAIVPAAVAEQTEVAAEKVQKENPPHPLKKNTSSSLPSLFSSSEEEEREERSGGTRAREVDRAFDERFWPPYPNKVGKAAARRAFGRALRRVDLETMLAGWRRYIAKTDDRAWCNPATWLNDDRWLDEPAVQGRGPPQQRGNGGGFASVMVDRYREQHDGGTGNHDGAYGLAAPA